MPRPPPLPLHWPAKVGPLGGAWPRGRRRLANLGDSLTAACWSGGVLIDYAPISRTGRRGGGLAGAPAPEGTERPRAGLPTARYRKQRGPRDGSQARDLVRAGPD